MLVKSFFNIRHLKNCKIKFFSIIHSNICMKKVFLLSFWLPKIPLLSLIGVFMLPLILMSINRKLGLFFIAFYISYWSVKVFEMYYYVLKSYWKLLKYAKYDWQNDSIVAKHAKDLQHIVIVPIYTEPYKVIEENVTSILNTRYAFKENVTILLATESRAPDAEKHAKKIIECYNGINQVTIISIVHPSNLPNEWRVKWANISYAIETYETMVSLVPENTFVSTIDTDSKVEKDFFSIVTHTFYKSGHRNNAIYQYTPIYSNNWHEGRFFAKIIGVGTTIWQFFESQNPEFYRNFAVYGQSLKCLHKANYWDKKSIVEDGMQYWRSYFGWDGKFRIIYTPAVCEMDLVDEHNLYRTIRSQYKQLRRWSWGCTDIEYVIPQALANKKIPRWEKIRKIVYLIFNHLFWAGGPFMLFFIGFVPWMFGDVNHSLAAMTVPLATSIIFTFLFTTVIIPSLLSIHIMRRYTTFRIKDYIFNFTQWIAIPLLTLTLFSIPAIVSQIRLFFNRRIDTFDTTKKMDRTK